MNFQTNLLKGIGTVAGMTALVKASPEYAEKLRMQGLNKEELYQRQLFDLAVRKIEDPDIQAGQEDLNKAMSAYGSIGNMLEAQGKYDEALKHRRGEDAIVHELMSHLPAQRSTDSVQNARVVKSAQTDMTASMRDFYRDIRMGGDK